MGLADPVGAYGFAEFEDERFSDAVENALAVALAVEDAGGPHEGEMFGDVGLCGACGAHDVADAEGLFAHGLEDAQAHGFAEHFEEGGDLLEVLF